MSQKITKKDRAFQQLSKRAQLVIELEEAKDDLEKFDIAIRRENLNLLQYFLTMGFSPNTMINRVKYIPTFFFASILCSEKMAILFYRHGLNINLADSHQNNIAHECLTSVCFQQSAISPDLAKKTLELFKLFLSWGVSLEHKNQFDQTPLDILEDYFLQKTSLSLDVKKRVQDALEDVQSGAFHFQDSLGQIEPLSPNDLVLTLTDEDRQQMDLYRRGDYVSLLKSNDLKLGYELSTFFYLADTEEVKNLDKRILRF